MFRFYILCTVYFAKCDKFYVQNIETQRKLGKSVDKQTWQWYDDVVKKTWQQCSDKNRLEHKGEIYYDKRRNPRKKQRRKQE